MEPGNMSTRFENIGGDYAEYSLAFLTITGVGVALVLGMLSLAVIAGDAAANTASGEIPEIVPISEKGVWLEVGKHNYRLCYPDGNVGLLYPKCGIWYAREPVNVPPHTESYR